MKTSHLNALRAMEATLRTGNFRSAAVELDVTPAAVGQQVHILEDYLGRKLFVRTPTGVKATESANLVADKLTTSFSSISDVLAQLKGRRSEKALALTMTQSFAESWLTPRLSNFYAKDIEVDLRIVTTNRMVDLFQDEIDLAIRYSPPAGKGHVDILLFSEYLVPVCSPDFAKQYDFSRNRSTLENIPLLHLHEASTDPEWIGWVAWGEKFGFGKAGLERGLRFSKVNYGLQGAMSGHGLALASIYEAYNALRDGRLVMPFGPELVSKTGFDYRLVTAAGRYKSKIQKGFEDWIVEEARVYSSSLAELISVD
jgi:LysR family glycine cleavage system transcriptional activator